MFDSSRSVMTPRVYRALNGQIAILQEYCAPDGEPRYLRVMVDARDALELADEIKKAVDEAYLNPIVPLSEKMKRWGLHG